jgi:palmitoyl transferase
MCGALRHVLVSLLFAPSIALGIDCDALGEHVGYPCRKSVAAGKEGRNELYLSGYAHHDRRTYDTDRIHQLNENARGLGLARSIEEPDGNAHAVYVLAFRDSHFKLQTAIGYQWQVYWHFTTDLKAGVGVTAFLFSRSDMAHYFPLPFALPVVSLGYGRATLYGTFIPKASRTAGGNGNVGYLFAGFRF